MASIDDFAEREPAPATGLDNLNIRIPVISGPAGDGRIFAYDRRSGWGWTRTAENTWVSGIITATRSLGLSWTVVVDGYGIVADGVSLFIDALELAVTTFHALRARFTDRIADAIEAGAGSTVYVTTDWEKAYLFGLPSPVKVSDSGLFHLDWHYRHSIGNSSVYVLKWVYVGSAR